jgi:hypothetical protein
VMMRIVLIFLLLCTPALAGVCGARRHVASTDGGRDERPQNPDARWPPMARGDGEKGYIAPGLISAVRTRADADGATVNTG